MSEESEYIIRFPSEHDSSDSQRQRRAAIECEKILRMRIYDGIYTYRSLRATASIRADLKPEGRLTRLPSIVIFQKSKQRPLEPRKTHFFL